MAKSKKKSFVMYNDWGGAIDNMSDAQAGQLLKSVYNHVRNMDSIPVDDSIKFVLDIIKGKIQEDTDTYDEMCNKRSDWGKQGKNKQLGISQHKSNDVGISQDIPADMIGYEVIGNDMKGNDMSCSDDKTKDVKTKEKINKKKAAASARTGDADLDAAVEDFKEARQKIRKPMTDKAVELFIKRLQELAPDDTSKKIELIDTAIVNGWQTVYLPKDENARSGTTGSAYIDNIKNRVKVVDSWV